MKRLEISYGIVPLRFLNGQREILLAKTGRDDYYCIPKGHMERSDRSHVEAAARELEEETGHVPATYGSDRGGTQEQSRATALEPVEYVFHKRNGDEIHKSIIFYIAEVFKKSEIKDKREIQLIQWFPINQQTINLLHFRESIDHFSTCILPKISWN